MLCIGAHSDDIEIGASGTVLELLAERKDLSVVWVVCTAAGVREAEANASASAILAGAARRDVVVKQFRNGYFPYVGAEIKDFFETLKSFPDPSLILTHCRHDLHQDHRVVSELTWNTFRNHWILEYEIPKYDADLGSPNVFVGIQESTLTRKIENLMNCFASQRDKDWFDGDTFRSLAKLRGNECNATAGFAEAFYGRKSLLS